MNIFRPCVEVRTEPLRIIVLPKPGGESSDKTEHPVRPPRVAVSLVLSPAPIDVLPNQSPGVPRMIPMTFVPQGRIKVMGIIALGSTVIGIIPTLPLDLGVQVEPRRVAHDLAVSQPFGFTPAHARGLVTLGYVGEPLPSGHRPLGDGITPDGG